MAVNTVSRRRAACSYAGTIIYPHPDGVIDAAARGAVNRLYTFSLIPTTPGKRTATVGLDTRTIAIGLDSRTVEISLDTRTIGLD